MKITSTLLCLAAAFSALAQPGIVRMTPVRHIKLYPSRLVVPARYKGKIDSTHIVYLPQGYRAQVFYAGQLSKPRFMSWGPDSVLYVANMTSGEILALPDRNKDHIADTAIVAASNAYCHDVKFYNGDMYAAEELKVEKLQDLNQDGIYETRSTFIDSIIPGVQQPPGGHKTRTLLFDPPHSKVYLSIGSSCNVCRESNRSIILQFDINGKNKKTFASGVRNAVGMTLNPYTGRIWADNNGSDNQGHDIPPEWIDQVRENGFYGHPFAYADQVYFDFNRDNTYKALLPITKADSDQVRRMMRPGALIQAHSAPMAMKFSNSSFPGIYNSGAFVVTRGSFGLSPATGYKVMFLKFGSMTDTVAESVSDFFTGFLTDSVQSVAWARPVGLETDNKGSIYMSSDDLTQFIAVVYYDPSISGMQQGKENGYQLGSYPQPATGSCTVSFTLPAASPMKLELFDAAGHLVRVLDEGRREAGTHRIRIPESTLAPGLYFCILSAPDVRITGKMIITGF